MQSSDSGIVELNAQSQLIHHCKSLLSPFSQFKTQGLVTNHACVNNFILWRKITYTTRFSVVIIIATGRWYFQGEEIDLNR